MSDTELVLSDSGSATGVSADLQMLLRRIVSHHAPPNPAEWSEIRGLAERCFVRGVQLQGGGPGSPVPRGESNELVTVMSDEGGVHAHLAVLWAAPLVRKVEGRLVVLSGIDHEAELAILQDSLFAAQRAIRFQTACATTETLREFINGGLRLLHLSGHGIVDELGRDFLVFEVSIYGNN